MSNENPVDYLIRRCGMTRIAFTREFGFGENHLLLISQGRKESVGPKLLSALAIACSNRGVRTSIELKNQYGVDTVEDAYATWVQDQRGRANMPPRIQPGLGSPFARLVKHFGSVAKTAQVLRVRDINVRKYMDTDRMPVPIFDALADTPWGEEGAEILDAQQKRYFKDKGRKR